MNVKIERLEIIVRACSLVISVRASVIHSSELDHVTMMSASGEEFQSAVGEELDSEGASGLFTDPPILRVKTPKRSGARDTAGTFTPRDSVTLNGQIGIPPEFISIPVETGRRDLISTAPCSERGLSVGAGTLQGDESGMLKMKLKPRRASRHACSPLSERTHMKHAVCVVVCVLSPGWRTEEPRTRGGRRRNGGKRKNKGQVTIGQRSHTSGQVQHTFSTTSDPCLTSHRDYCIHGYCTYLQDLKEPVCVCMKGYDGVRCGIQLLQTFSGSGSDGLDTHTHAHTLQLALVIISVILSMISCSAIIIIITVQYKAQHGFQAAFLSSSSEREKLHKSPVA
ncbi:hypothetical protein NFI96_013778 [Prochilodus magdalenae]|nr:hypothetical protein NFI96_013778 [Prochilodus magdalenae]